MVPGREHVDETEDLSAHVSSDGGVVAVALVRTVVFAFVFKGCDDPGHQLVRVEHKTKNAHLCTPTPSCISDFAAVTGGELMGSRPSGDDGEQKPSKERESSFRGW